VTPGRRVTVIVPARNEVADIAGCIDAIGRQDIPLTDIQLIVVDAASEDGTRRKAMRAAARHAFGEVLVLDNPARRTSVGLNIGLRHAQGALVARADARSRIPPGYLRSCAATLAGHPEVGVVGAAGRWTWGSPARCGIAWRPA